MWMWPYTSKNEINIFWTIQFGLSTYRFLKVFIKWIWNYKNNHVHDHSMWLYFLLYSVNVIVHTISDDFFFTRALLSTPCCVYATIHELYACPYFSTNIFLKNNNKIPHNSDAEFYERLPSSFVDGICSNSLSKTNNMRTYGCTLELWSINMDPNSLLSINIKNPKLDEHGSRCVFLNRLLHNIYEPMVSNSRSDL